MKKIKLYIAQSLNGKIAKPDGGVEWLEAIPNSDNIDYGYSEFYNSIDTTIQGYNTYRQIIEWEISFPYADKKNYVLTQKKHLEKTEYVEFISQNHVEKIKEIKKNDGKDIWLIGGAQINSMLLKHNLIDEIIVFVMPIILPGGIELIERIPKETILNLQEIRSFSNGAVELKYKLI